ncbi:histone family protein nucleoid-structuring protein H-NS [Pelomonas sp. HMWF004]|nr:histone family protein nucleoid-structuring protein H-NS [Pelomonas sp. HMWF004]
MASLKELIEQREKLDRQIQETQANERSAAIEKVKALMAEYGLSITDLSARSPKKGPVPGQSKVAAKYRNQATGETWSGRGLQPKWLKAAVAGGAKIEDFAV